jgi:hypothetical protein
MYQSRSSAARADGASVDRGVFIRWFGVGHRNQVAPALVRECEVDQGVNEHASMLPTRACRRIVGPPEAHA